MWWQASGSSSSGDGVCEGPGSGLIGPEGLGGSSGTSCPTASSAVVSPSSTYLSPDPTQLPILCPSTPVFRFLLDSGVIMAQVKLLEESTEPGRGVAWAESQEPEGEFQKAAFDHQDQGFPAPATKEEHMGVHESGPVSERVGWAGTSRGCRHPQRGTY